MVVQKIIDIDVKKMKHAKGVMAVLELLGISEEDLLLLKEIPAMKEELAELREFKSNVLRTLSNQTSNDEKKPVSQVVKDVYGTPTKEFNPHYE